MTFIEFILSGNFNKFSEKKMSTIPELDFKQEPILVTEVTEKNIDLDCLLDYYSNTFDSTQEVEIICSDSDYDDDEYIYGNSRVFNTSTKKVYWKEPLSETIIYNDNINYDNTAIKMESFENYDNYIETLKYINSTDISETLQVFSICKIGSAIKISDENCIIDNVYTNNTDCVYISNTVQKSLFKKKIVYNISFSKIGSGFLKITFKNKEKILIHGFYIIGDNNQDNTKISPGLIINSPKNLSFWTDDVYLPDKNIIDSYFRITEYTILSEIASYFNTCKRLGIKCNIEYSVMVTDTPQELVSYERYLDLRSKYENLDYMKDYLVKFEDTIKAISEFTCNVLELVVIFEPYLLFNIYNFHKNSNGNPKKVYCSYRDNGKDNIVDFIRKINNVCEEYDINISHVIGVSDNYHKLLKNFDLFEDLDISSCLYSFEEEAYQVSSWINFFINPMTNYITFIGYSKRGPWNNDQWMTFIFYVKNVLEKLKSKHLLVDIMGILCNLDCGHPNNSKSISKYTNKPFENHTNITPNDNENTASLFFFGDTIGNCDGYNVNKWDDSNIKRLSDNTTKFLGHMNFCQEIGLKKLLFGSCTNNGVTSTPSSYTPVSDHNYTISKIYEYTKLNL
jgi:hypothetical protein